MIVAEGSFGPLFRAYTEHVRRWEVEPDGLAFTMMRQGLGAAALHLCFRPHDESVGFTLNVRKPPVNIFITGDGETSTVTGRAFTEGVRTAEVSRLFVESQRPGQEQSRSLVEVDGLDVLQIFEQYYARSEQSPARLFEITDERFVMIKSLPDSSPEWLAGLDRERAATLDGDPLDERVFRFQCGCSPEKMISALHTIFGPDLDTETGLFRGDPGVEAFCPRCGSQWWIERADYDAWKPAEESG